MLFFHSLFFKKEYIKLKKLITLFFAPYSILTYYDLSLTMIENYTKYQNYTNILILLYTKRKKRKKKKKKVLKKGIKF